MLYLRLPTVLVTWCGWRRFGKVLVLSHQHGLLPLTLALVSALSVPEVLVERGLAADGEEESRPPKHLLALRYGYRYRLPD